MTKKFAPAGATAKLCVSDLVPLDRGYLDSIVALLRDPTRTRGPGLTGIVDDFEQAFATSDLPGACWKRFSASVGLPEGGYVTVSAPRMDDLETTVAAVRAAFEPAPVAPAATDTFDWDAVHSEIKALWPSVEKADIATSLRLQRLKLEIEIDERDSYDPDAFDADNELRLVRLQQKTLKLLAGLQKLVPPLEDHAGPASESPEAVAEAKLAARDARRPQHVDVRIEWNDGSTTARWLGNVDEFDSWLAGYRAEGLLP